ncbi:MAG TPA: molecular chaperone HtpG [Xanthomonadales bacterium]|nr:molecular chaperone HtpG [Xanthomonadales bacterium]
MGKKSKAAATAVRHQFQAETRQVLRLMINSLYSNKDIFLRELISNASDALDRLRFASLQDPGLLNEAALQITIQVDRKAGTLTVRDNGIGMSQQDVMENIGTIARSGTRRFLEQLAEDQKANASLIGQFGVGFYSAFIVADAVTVLTRRAGDGAEQGVRWWSDGGGEFTIESEPREHPGTEVILHLKPAEQEYLESWTLKSLIQRYSDHIGFPIMLLKESGEGTAEAEPEWEQVNKATALWTLPRNEISDEEYRAFYKYLSHDLDDPLCWAHNKVEGAQNYTTLLYAPKKAPLDLMLQRDERTGVRLYVNRVFIMDGAQSLLPHYLRFIRGVVDSQDLPLNVSRELLQENELVGKIRAAVIRRSLDMIARLSRDDAEAYKSFYQQFGSVLKEGVVEDFANRERILNLLRFASTHEPTAGAQTDLAAYLARMKTGQDSIYYITAEHHVAASNSPHLEIFRKKGIEVLLLSDRVDEWMMSYLHEYEGKPFRSVAKGDIDLSSIEVVAEAAAKDRTEESAAIDPALLKRVSDALTGHVSAVRPSQRLTDSASCLVLKEHDMALHLQKLLKQAGQQIPESKPDLELNASHPLVARLAAEADDEQFGMLCLLLYEQALLSEGGSLPDPAGFVRRINTLMTAAPATA